MLVPARELWPAQLALVGLLLFVPGIALLRVVRVPPRAIAATPVYVPVASLVVLLAAGLAVDLLGPVIGINTPLRVAPLLISVEAACASLVFIAAMRSPVRRGGKLSFVLPRIRDLWPLLLPAASAAGAARLTDGHGPAVAIAAAAGCVLVIAIVLVAAPRMTRAQLAVLVYGVSLALVWSFSLRSGFVYGADIATEYHVVHSTQAAGVWHLAHPNDAYGAMLSLTVLPAVFHNIGGVSELAILKALYPALLALLPVVVFMVARRFLTARYAAAAAVLMIVQGDFFQAIPAIARQEIALVAFGVLVAVLVDRNVPRPARLAFAACLSLTLVVFHYSTTYFAIVVLGLAVVLQVLISLFRPLPRANIALVGAFATILAGATLWYGPLTQSASNLGGFRGAFTAHGFQRLPNRQPGESIISAYLNGTTTPQVDAAQYAALATRDYAVSHPYVIPLPDAVSTQYTLQDASVPGTAARAPKLAAELSVARVALQELLNLLAVLAVVFLALRRRGPPALRVLALVGVGTVALLVTIRLSGTLATLYNQDRAQVQGLVALAVGVAWALQAGIRRSGRFGRVGVAAVGAGAVILLLNTSGFTGATLGTGAAVNLANHGEDYERFYITPPELSAARWLGSAMPSKALLYTDLYGRLPVFSQLGSPPTLLFDLAPQVIDQHAWVYASATNVVDGRARGVSSGHFAIYRFPVRFLTDNFNTVYANGSSEVFHR